MLDGGETSGEDRLPFLDTGVLDILAEATGGLSIVLEHRYYGTSRMTLYIKINPDRHLLQARPSPWQTLPRILCGKLTSSSLNELFTPMYQLA